MADIHPRILKISRLEGLTDGVFAIAMTILALDLRLPDEVTPATLHEVFYSVIFIKLLIYCGSFVILGTLWVAMNFQIGLLKAINRPYLWSQILYLMVVCIVPFSANLLANFPHSQLAISVFAVNLIFANAVQYLTFRCSHHFKLNGELHTPKIHRAIILRLSLAPVLNFAALIVAFWSPALAFLILIMPPIIYIFPGRVDKANKC